MTAKARTRPATPSERRLLARGLRRWHGVRLPGGLPAKHHLRPSMFNPDQLAIGAKVELEHTRDPGLAIEIAMGHLYEDRRYYAKLQRMEAGEYGGASSAAGVGLVLLLLVGASAVTALVARKL